MTNAIASTTYRNPTAPTHNILFTIPRTASHLAIRILNLPNQNSVTHHPSDGYFFLSALSYRYEHMTYARPITEWSNDEFEGMNNILQESLITWKKWVEDAELAGGGTFIKEHINFMLRPEVESNFLFHDDKTYEDLGNNPTCIPDTFLAKIRPTFLIRHPALVIPSLMRVALDLEGMEIVLTRSSENSMRIEGSYHWHVALYRYLLNLPSCPYTTGVAGVTYPIILDASDLSKPDLMSKYARVVGLDWARLQFKWESAHSEKVGKTEARMKDTILQSEGVVMEKLGGFAKVDIEENEKIWKREFGEILGTRVARLVRDATPDYEWLAERRLRL
jgi:hypothetical protein